MLPGTRVLGGCLCWSRSASLPNGENSGKLFAMAHQLTFGPQDGLPLTSRAPRLVAAAEGAAATAIWSSSFVVSQVGLRYLGPFTVVGLQYLVAFAVLTPFLALDLGRRPRLTPRAWGQLATLGLTAYVVGNGTLIWGLKWIPAATAALLLSATPLLVMIGASAWLKEPPTGEQVAGILLTAAGGVLFFLRGAAAGRPLGIAIVASGVVAYAGFSLVGRDVARDARVGTIVMTAVPFGIAGFVLTAAAIATEGWPAMSWRIAGVLVWLGIVDTAGAYALYNRALGLLTATEMSALIAMTPLGTAVIAWVWLGQQLGSLQIVGMLCVIAGVLAVESRLVARTPLPMAVPARSRSDD